MSSKTSVPGWVDPDQSVEKHRIKGTLPEHTNTVPTAESVTDGQEEGVSANGKTGNTRGILIALFWLF